MKVEPNFKIKVMGDSVEADGKHLFVNYMQDDENMPDYIRFTIYGPEETYVDVDPDDVAKMCDLILKFLDVVQQ